MSLKQIILIFGASLFSYSAPAAIIWNIGIDDNAQDGEGDAALNDPATLNGVDFNVSGVRESGQQDLPGNPANIGGASGDDARDVDDDYYFAGVYTTAAGDGGYEPVGVVSESESYYDRALTAGDPNMRWHFNLPETVAPDDYFTFTIDFHNLSETNAADISSYDLTFWVDGKQVGEMQPHMDIDLPTAQSWDFDLDDLGGIEKVGPGFDHYVEIRSTPTGSARWSSLDYAQLEVSSEPKVEDDPNISAANALNFGDIKVGGETATETIVFTNTGQAQNLVISELTLGGERPDAFSLNAPDLPLVIAPGAEAQIELSVTPGDIEESVSAELIVTSNDTSDGEIIVRFGARFFVPFGNEGTLWFVGVDDDGQDGDGNASLNDPAFFNGVDFFASGVQESGEDILPGNPANTGGAGNNRDVDDDYYFAGSYNTVVDGGDYTPVGDVDVNESYFDRALTNGDPNMRWHFNVPRTVGPNDAFTFTVDFYNLNESDPTVESGYDLTFFVDGKQIGEMQPHSEVDFSAAQSWDFTLDDLGGTAELGAGFDHYVEVRSTPTGSSRWASLDYAKVDIIAGANQDLIITELSVDPDNNNVTFSFQAKVGLIYAVDRSTTLRSSGEPGGWLEINDSLVAQSEIQSFTDPGAAADNAKFFYRVRVAEE
ncbi:choice-of-anchor D domain-containing protein [Akkermansiaceae bacterium]|nr:choice-of-anchor D domain-containing protein [Akkermansiaceae bacterium]MDA7612200.1 choice-of-anchor D domain-containing protein [bacterium]MDA7522336.1 choice-of-anchor D domain-containing protein [Akkermansiaceae bacterium]MDA7539507.1 choice-of-anchor D domain-containing protein [Akkermansiaceae bacterium]MDA7616551.1 choice-of-anchor D domain-containing protein [bacterium]